MKMQAVPDRIGNGRYTFRSYTRLTEDIQPASRLKIRQEESITPAGYEVVSLLDNEKKEVVFLNTGKEILCFFTKKNGHGFDQVSIPAGGKKLAAKLHLGRIHLLFISGDSVHAAIEKTPGSREFELSEPFGHFECCTHLVVQDFYGTLYVGIGGYRGNAWCSLHILEEKRPMFGIGFTGEVLDIAINGTDSGNAQFYYMIKEADGKIQVIGKNIFSVVKRQYYCIQDPKKNYYDYHLVPGGGIMYYRFSYGDKSQFNTLNPLNNVGGNEKTDDDNFSGYCTKIDRMEAVGIVSAAKGHIHNEFFYTTDTRFVHKELNRPGFENSTMAVLDWKVGDFCLLDGNRTDVLYYVALDASGQYRIVRLEYDFVDKRWEEYDITLSEDERMVDLPCYTTEITFYGVESNRPAPNLPVILYTDENVLLDTPLGLREVGKEKKLALKTDQSGKIYFTQYCDSLYAVPVLLDVPDMRMNGQVIAIHQFEETKARIKGLSQNDIANAKKTNPRKDKDEYVLDQANARENARAIKSALNQLFANDRRVSLNPCCMGAYLCSAEDTFALREWQANPDSRWSLTLHDGCLMYQDHTAEEAGRIMADMQPNQDNGIREWFASIGEFFRSIGKAIVKVVKLVVDGVKAAINFVLDGVTYVLNWVLDKVSVVLDAVAVVFSTAVVYFLDMFFWLGFQVRWNDILRTKKAINAVISLGIREVPRRMKNYDQQFLAQLREMKDHVKEWLDAGAGQVGSQTLAGYQKQHQNPQLESAVSNNMLLRRLETEELGVVLSAEDMVLLWKESGWYDTLQDISDQLENSQTLTRVKKYIEEAVTQPDKLFTCLASVFVELIIAAVELLLDGLYAMFEKFLDMVESLFEMFLKKISAKIKLPFFTALYKGIAGEELSLADLGSLLIANVVTMVYKLIWGKVPLRDQKDYDCFVREISRLEQVSENGDGGAVVADWVEILLGVIGNVAGGIAVITGGLNSCRMNLAMEEDNSINGLSVLTLVLEFIWLSVSAPWFFAASPHGFSIAFWIFLIVSFLIDVAFACKEVVKLYLIYLLIGLVHAIMGIVNIGLGLCNVNSLIVELLCSISEALTYMAGMAKEPDTKLIVAALDFFLGVGVIIHGISSVTGDGEPVLVQ